jgi:hypothetical protein
VINWVREPPNSDGTRKTATATTALGIPTAMATLASANKGELRELNDFTISAIASHFVIGRIPP